jgi:stage V sporulation protein B
VLGSGLAACISLLSLAILRILEHPPKGPKIPVAKVILDTSLPLAIADDLRTGITTVENLIVPRRLALFEGSIAPLAAFGTVCGMVFPILMFPVAILYGMTELLVPELARCRAANSQIRIDYLITRGLRIALLYGTLCAGILYLSGDGLCMQLYDSKEAARYLRLFAPLAVMLYCDAVTDSMIKGLGQQKASVRYNILTNSMDVLFLYIWLPQYGMNGYFWSFLLTHAVNFVLSIRRLLRISRVQIDWKTPAITLVVSLLSVWLAGFASTALLRAIAYILLLPTGLCITNVLNREDLIWLKGLIRRENGTNT